MTEQLGRASSQPAGWSLTGDPLPRPRWWAAVSTGLAAPLLVTPLGDAIPGPWRAGLVLGLAFVAMVLGLWGAVRTALAQGWWSMTRVGPAALPVVGAAGAWCAGAWLWSTGVTDLRLPAVAGFATAAHLAASTMLRSVLRTVPAADPRAGMAQMRVRRPWVERLLRVVPWMPLGALGLAALVFISGAVSGGAHTAPEWLSRAVAVALATAPMSFLLARAVPASAARDRGRELGLYFGGVDLDRAAAVRSIALDPMGLVTDRRPRLVGVRTSGRLQTTAALQAAASVAAGSSVGEFQTLAASAAGRAIALRPAEVVFDDPAHLTRVCRIKTTEVTLGPASAFSRVPVPLAADGTVLFVGWGGVARAGFDFVPSVRSDALDAWPLLRGYGVRPLFRSDEAPALRHVASAMEVPATDLYTTDEALVEAARESGPALVVAHGCMETALPGEPVVLRFGAPAQPGMPADEIRSEHVDLRSATSVIGLARKARRVTTQGLVLASVLWLGSLLGALAGWIEPFTAAFVGAATPVVVAANALRPRSYARERS